jgi:hypothetical protein
MSTVLTTEPSTIRAGDFLTWLKSLSEYPANAGWSLSYTLINDSTKITINAAASGADHLVSVLAATSANYASGLYSWMARVTKATEIYTIASGSIEILPNLAALTIFDGRSHARIMVQAIEAAIQGRASSTQLEYEINGRRVRNMDPGDLIKWLSFYRAELAKEAQVESIRRTGVNPRNIGVRFHRV